MVKADIDTIFETEEHEPVVVLAYFVETIKTFLIDMPRRDDDTVTLQGICNSHENFLAVTQERGSDGAKGCFSATAWQIVEDNYVDVTGDDLIRAAKIMQARQEHKPVLAAEDFNNLLGGIMECHANATRFLAPSLSR